MKKWIFRFLVFVDICGFLCTIWAYIWNDWYAGWFAWFIPLTIFLVVYKSGLWTEIDIKKES